MMSWKLSSRTVMITAAVAVAVASSFHPSKIALAEDKIALSSKEFRSFRVKKITTINHNVRSYEFDLPGPDYVLGTTTASCIVVKGPLDTDGKPMIRPYTPTSIPSEKGHFELVVKSYPEGKVSKYFSELKVGDKVEVKGPISKFPYKSNMKKTISMVAGGSGITPMIQVIKEIINNPEDKTEIHLIFANNTEEDIIMKSYFDSIAAKYPRVKVTYVITKTNNKSFKGYVGHINKDLLLQKIPKPSTDTMVLVCGPPSFMKDISGPKTPDYKQGLVDGILKELGYNEEQVFKF